jgi:hypothetical protein
VTAAEAVVHARAAGLTLLPHPAGLRVRGPKQARAALLPMLAPMVGEILRLLAPENRAPEVPALGEREPCDGCGRTDWVVTVVMEYGARLCPRCWTSGGAK